MITTNLAFSAGRIQRTMARWRGLQRLTGAILQNNEHNVTELSQGRPIDGAQPQPHASCSSEHGGRLALVVSLWPKPQSTYPSRTTDKKAVSAAGAGHGTWDCGFAHGISVSISETDSRQQRVPMPQVHQPSAVEQRVLPRKMFRGRREPTPHQPNLLRGGEMAEPRRGTALVAAELRLLPTLPGRPCFQHRPVSKTRLNPSEPRPQSSPHRTAPWVCLHEICFRTATAPCRTTDSGAPKLTWPLAQQSPEKWSRDSSV
ncbi:hypothetical protein B0T14DRAFT_235891 [Immersiella caudata]|uniref:Uncharacterized protein n=1 Tax=Immersiella caudata TaxID=314043 RepID=A0AA39WSS8_9PEZI|nr:hypothetical protein B0T14DRAFT_235891 [Immersiella caudata]